MNGMLSAESYSTQDSIRRRGSYLKNRQLLLEVRILKLALIIIIYRSLIIPKGRKQWAIIYQDDIPHK